MNLLKLSTATALLAVAFTSNICLSLQAPSSSSSKVKTLLTFKQQKLSQSEEQYSEQMDLGYAVEILETVQQITFEISDELEDVLGKGPDMMNRIQNQYNYSADWPLLGYAMQKVRTYNQSDFLTIQSIIANNVELIDSLYSSMFYITDLMHSYQNDTCIQRLTLSRDKILSAYQALALYVVAVSEDSELKQNFMDQCSDESCQDALQRIIYSIIGDSPSDCLFLDLVQYGNVAQGFQKGNTDVLAYQSAYLLLLINFGMTVESSFRYMMDDEDDDEIIFESLRDVYGSRILDVGDKISQLYQDTLANYFDNSHINLQQQADNLFDMQLKDDNLVNGLMEYIKKFVNYYNPAINWQVFTYQGQTQPAWCVNCFIYSNSDLQQNVVFYYYNTTWTLKSALDLQKLIFSQINNFKDVYTFKNYLMNSSSLICFSSLIFLPSLPRVFDQGASNQYTSVLGKNFSLIFWTIVAPTQTSTDPNSTQQQQLCVNQDTQQLQNLSIKIEIIQDDSSDSSSSASISDWGTPQNLWQPEQLVVFH